MTRITCGAMGGWAAVLVVGALSAGSPAWASDLDVGVEPTVTVPGQLPHLVLSIHRATRNIKVDLRAGDGVTLVTQTGPLKAGQTRRLKLQQPVGQHHWSGALTVTYPNTDAPSTLPLTFDTAVLAPPALHVRAADLDLDGHRLTATMNRACHRLVFTVYGDDGQVMDQGDADMRDTPPGQPLPVVWKPTAARVLRIDLVGHDTFGLFSPTLSLFPWSLEIPHQDVNFPTGSAEIPPDQAAKVDAAVADIRTAIRRYGGLVAIRLFVGGHTDSVGSAESNQALSQGRARAIARQMRRSGVKIPIHFQGFGESKPRVPTPDETDEPANRRATYILGVEPPSPGWSVL